MTHVAFPRPCCAHQSAKARDKVSPSRTLFRKILAIHHHDIIVFKLLRIRDFLGFVHHLSWRSVKMGGVKRK